MSCCSPNQANIYKTTDDFATITALPEPNDADTSINSTDFTRNQSYYDLEIEVDPNDDDIVYAGESIGTEVVTEVKTGSNF